MRYPHCLLQVDLCIGPNEFWESGTELEIVVDDGSSLIVKRPEKDERVPIVRKWVQEIQSDIVQ
jgi:hypothetical protein